MAPTLRSSPSRTSRSSRTRPLRSSRIKVQSYYEESSSDNGLGERSGSDEAAFGDSTAMSLRPRRANRMPTSYREDSSDDSFGEDNYYDADATASVEPPTRSPCPVPQSASNGTSSRTRRRTIATRGQTQKSRKRKSTSQSIMEIGRPLRKNKRQRAEAIEPAFVYSGVIPPWQTLPYHVLFDILYYASHPLVDEKSGIRLDSVQWLVNVASLCRAFYDPAIAALYYRPPLIPAAKCHGLLELLCQPQDVLSTTYTSKIKVLDVDVETLLLHKSGPGLGYFKLSRLIKKTPQVKTLRLYHRNDYIVGLPHWQIPRSKWTYPETLFSSINSSPIVLRSWDWNTRFMETERLLPFMFAIHQQRAFRGLHELRLLHVEGSPAEGDFALSYGRELTLATALKQLPELHRLEFRECSILNERLLLNLPSELICLTIDNCDEVTAETLGGFLASHGHHLREMNLNHNRNLSISFLGGLAQSCGNLEKLKMDLSVHDWSSYHDVEPHFEELLNPSKIPTWPATLQDIEFNQLRKWDDTGAEVFFTSLVDAAPELRNLRRLVISAILKIGWRDRATFREKWIGKLETVYLRRSKPPDPILNTIQQAGQVLLAGNSATEDITHSDAHTANGTDSALSTPSKRKSARLAQRKLSEVENQSDLKSARSMSSSQTINKQPLFIQGMCDVVMIRIDNQRPTETQFNENDFLDDELSGDEDWSGRDLEIGEGYAW